MQVTKQQHERGFTLAELMFASMVFAILASVMLNHLSINYATTASERDRVFAYSKAQSILSEIQAYVDRGQAAAAVDLDVLDDGTVNNPLLTISTRVNGSSLKPDDELSGNFSNGNDWTWSRRVTVRPFQGLNNRNVRYVTVHIYKRNLENVERPVAELSAVINSAGSGYPTTQVFDIYLLAVENIPGWWVYMDSIRPFVESAITDLETRNPGLEVRTHWITKSSFGRNQSYRPYVNDVADSRQQIPFVYFYPARMPAGQSSAYYYVPDNIRGHINLDGTNAHGYDADTNPYPYALADFYNHSMRYPEELELFTARVAAVTARETAIADALALGNTPPLVLDDMSKEPTLRLFLEDLNTQPLKYKNAMIINLHGELLPAAPLRNYADPARSPENYPEVRVVTHAEELRTRRDSITTDAAKFRVYAFNSCTATYNTSTMPDRISQAIAIEVVGLDLTASSDHSKLDSTVQLKSLAGGVRVPLNTGSTNYSAFAVAKHTTDVLAAGEMNYSCEFINPPGSEAFTRIYLYNTPVVAPQPSSNGAGLPTNTQCQLYGMSYIPSPCDSTNPQAFVRDLSTSSNVPKNTARWTFSVPPAFLAAGRFYNSTGTSVTPVGDLILKVRTRLWVGSAPATSGTVWPVLNDPDNLSTTYTWWADSATDVPMTERSQFLGDPRHCPYKDLTTGATNDFVDGYNWYHDSLNNSNNARSNFLGLANVLANGWRGVMTCDVPRIMEIYRKGLVASACVYTTLTGFSYYYVGLGNDIGYDSANGYPNSIPIELSPMGTPNTTGYLDTITSSRRYVRDHKSPYWFAIPWLGELYPDWAYASQWTVTNGGVPQGNLTAGSNSNSFYQSPMQSAYSGSNRTAYGTSLVNSQQRTSSEGCTSFFNIGTTTSTFHHQSTLGTGNLTTVGTEITNNYSFTMPTTASISRPFSVASNTSGTIGTEFSLPPYSTQRYSASLLETYYTHPNGNTGAGLVRLANNTNASSAFVVVNGIDNTTSTGTTFIGKWAVLSLVHSYFEAGEAGVTHRIKMPPRIEIQSPNDVTELLDPASVVISFKTSWMRWDGKPYVATGTYSDNENELSYAIYYSIDGGDTWRHVQDDQAGTPGEKPTNSSYLIADTHTGDESFSLATPSAQFSEGTYQLRIDCFRNGANVHYSQHRTKFYLNR